jgi:uncharacterized membrane protein YecN with MAPEG domain
MLLPTTLCLAAAAAVINLWLSIRIGNLRMKGKILYGDGGDEMLMRRMRAHANFVENTPLVLILIAAIEAAGKGATWLAVVGGIYMLGRIGHGFGMDGGSRQPLRSAGAAITMLTQIALAVVAVLVALGRF